VILCLESPVAIGSVEVVVRVKSVRLVIGVNLVVVVVHDVDVLAQDLAKVYHRNPLVWTLENKAFLWIPFNIIKSRSRGRDDEN